MTHKSSASMPRCAGPIWHRPIDRGRDDSSNKLALADLRDDVRAVVATDESAASRTRTWKKLIQHQIYHHTRDRYVQPDRECPSGNASMSGSAVAQSEIDGCQSKKRDGRGEHHVGDQY